MHSWCSQMGHSWWSQFPQIYAKHDPQKKSKVSSLRLKNSPPKSPNSWCSPSMKLLCLILTAHLSWLNIRPFKVAHQRWTLNSPWLIWNSPYINLIISNTQIHKIYQFNHLKYIIIFELIVIFRQHLDKICGAGRRKQVGGSPALNCLVS